jgi:sugar/nucleoside kinase (ribokinase family)
MTAAERASFDYTAVGHVTIDVLPDGSRRAGGTAFYGALQAARMGARARILTQGVADEIEELLAPFAGELELEIRPASHTTTLLTAGTGLARRQRLLAWAGPIEEPIRVDSSVLHLAPIARETPGRFEGRADFIGLTPQGLVREWTAEDGEIALMGVSAEALAGVPERCDAIVLSDRELPTCAGLLATAVGGGAIAAVTAEAAPTRILLPDDRGLLVAVPAIDDPIDDLGAGDVFAAAFFLTLAEGRAASDAAAFATAAAAVRLSGPGAGAIGTLAAIEQRLRAVT